MQHYCGHCGAKLEDGVKFCGSCGAPVEQEEKTKRVQPKYSRITLAAILVLALCLTGFFVFGGRRGKNSSGAANVPGAPAASMNADGKTSPQPAARETAIPTAEPEETARAGKNDRIAWVLDTETVRNIKTGSVKVYQHDCKVDSLGRLTEDCICLYGDNGELNEIWSEQYQYDKDGNPVWKAERPTATYYEYDDAGNITLEASYYPSVFEEPEMRWASLDEVLAETRFGEKTEALAERYELFKRYSKLEEFVHNGEHYICIYIPETISEYEYDSGGKCLRGRSMTTDPAEDISYLYDYEDADDGYTKTAFAYKNSALSEKRVYHYDNLGREDGLVVYDAQGRERGYRFLVYDEAGNLVQNTNKTGVGKFTYDEHGNMLTAKHYDADGDMDTPRQTYEYTYKPVNY